jgi:hypothetical protein
VGGENNPAKNKAAFVSFFVAEESEENRLSIIFGGSV